MKLPPCYLVLFPQASCLRQEAFLYVPSVLSATPEIHSFPSPASTSVQPSVLAPSALARYDPDPTFVKPIVLASSDIVRLITDPASVSIETSHHLATASANRAAARTSGLLDPQFPSEQLHPSLETCSFLVPAPAGSNSIAHLADITGAAISSAPDIDTFVKVCQFQTTAAPPYLSSHLATPLLQSLANSGLLAAVGKPWYLDAIRSKIDRGPCTSTRNPASTAFCRAELSDRVSRGFSLLLILEMAILLFGRHLCILRLASAPETNWKDWLVCESAGPPPGGDLLLPPSSEDTPAVNMSTNRILAPQSMQFGPCLHLILQ